MFQTYSRSLLVVLLFLTAARADDKPTPRQIIDAYLEAVGGKAELEKVKSQRMKGTLTFTRINQKAKFELIQMRPNKLALTSDLAGVKIREGFDGKVGWSLNPITGAKLMAGRELEEKTEDADLAGDLREAKNYKSMENLGTVTFAKKKCWKLKFVRKSGAEFTEYYDVATKLRVGSERTMDTGTGSTKVTTTVLEYKAFGKIKHMSRFRQSLPDTDVETVISSVEYDKVNEKELALPAEIRALQSNER